MTKMKNMTIKNKATKTLKLKLTRTEFKTRISKTSICELALAIAAQSESRTCTEIATFIVKNLNVQDCFHKRESNKNNVVLQSTILRIRHHVKDCIKTYFLATKMYSYEASTDSVKFSKAYQETVKTDKTYRSHLRYMTDKIKTAYNAKAVKKTA